MLRHLILFFFLASSNLSKSQEIKSIQLRSLDKNNYSAIVPLGSTLELSFDDLEADGKDYRYKIEHMNHEWKKSKILSSQYIDGFDEITIFLEPGMGLLILWALEAQLKIFSSQFFPKDWE